MSPFIIQSHMSKGTWEAYIIYPKLKFNIIFPVEICPYRKQLTVSNGYQNDELFKIYIYIYYYINNILELNLKNFLLYCYF